MTSLISKEVTVYVRLLQEGTEVSRPTLARAIGNGVYCLLPTPDYAPEDEYWEFLPGSSVYAEERTGPDGAYLLAASVLLDRKRAV